MKASLDTNVILHLYRADKQNVLFDFFKEDIYIDEFIYTVELKNHGADIKEKLDQDINSGKIQVVTEEKLRELGIHSLYDEYLQEETILYSSADRGEACAIALARVLGAVSVVTDDTKPCGPHHTLMSLPDSDIIPFAYYELVFMLYLLDIYSTEETIKTLETIHKHSPDFNFDLIPKIKMFIKRTLISPYSERDKMWFDSFATEHNFNIKSKLKVLTEYIKNQTN